jgi:hypothetical protein
MLAGCGIEEDTLNRAALSVSGRAKVGETLSAVGSGALIGDVHWYYSSDKITIHHIRDGVSGAHNSRFTIPPTVHDVSLVSRYIMARRLCYGASVDSPWIGPVEPAAASPPAAGGI